MRCSEILGLYLSGNNSVTAQVIMMIDHEYNKFRFFDFGASSFCLICPYILIFIYLYSYLVNKKMQ